MKGRCRTYFCSTLTLLLTNLGWRYKINLVNNTVYRTSLTNFRLFYISSFSIREKLIANFKSNDVWTSLRGIGALVSFNFRLATTELLFRFFRVWGILYSCALLLLCGSVVGQAKGTLTVQRTNGRLRVNTSQTVFLHTHELVRNARKTVKQAARNRPHAMSPLRGCSLFYSFRITESPTQLVGLLK